MKEYCLGFAFYKTGNEVILIRKNRPDYQAGKLNGVGGKLEEGETPKFAMQREFAEETGVMTFLEHWDYVLTMQGKTFKVYVFRSILSDDQWDMIRSETDEEVIKLDIDELIHEDRMKNLDMLIQACLIQDSEMTDIVIHYNV